LKRKYGHKIEIISDTHGLVRQRVVKSFKGVDLIVHVSIAFLYVNGVSIDTEIVELKR
jgi:hypothetical protein